MTAILSVAVPDASLGHPFLEMASATASLFAEMAELALVFGNDGIKALIDIHV